jgi:Ca-activated chloride channel homolog
MTFLTVKPSRSKIAYSKPTEIFAAITFNPPKMEATRRAPLNISVALDNSGSMADSAGAFGLRKLDIAKIAVQKLIENLDESDALSLVTFESDVRTVFEPMQMTAAAKAQAKAKIEGIRDLGSTALHGGLMRAIDLATKGSGPPNVLRRVMLFTDGEANIGPRYAGEILPDVTRVLSGLSYKLGISTFGFGSRHNKELLRSLIRDGAYYFIEDAEMIPTAFGTELGGLVSTYATDVSLKIEAGPGIESFEVLNDLKVSGGKSNAHVDCHNLLSEQPYSVIIKAITKKGSRGGWTVPLFKVTASLKDLHLNTSISVTVESDVEWTTARGASKKDDALVMKAVAVQIAEKAQRDAMAAANRGDFNSAQTVLRTASLFATASGQAGLGTVLSSQAHDGYANQAQYVARGQAVSSSVSNTLSRQTAGTGGTVQGGIDVDSIFANDAQKQMAKRFSIKRAPRKTETP